MSKTKVAITLEEDSLQQLDIMVEQQVFKNRSQAIQKAVDQQLSKLKQSRLYAECEKLIPLTEQELADEGIHFELNEWSKY